MTRSLFKQAIIGVAASASFIFAVNGVQAQDAAGDLLADQDKIVA